MDAQFFAKQMDRLSETYGGQAYKKERVQVIWREVSDYSNSWFKSVIDKFIGEERHAPMMDKFREEIAKEREREWNLKKYQGSKEAENFIQSYSNEDTKTLIRVIVDRINGKVGDEEYASFTKSLHEIAESKMKTVYANVCPKCGNTGSVWIPESNGTEGVAKCNCVHGRNRRENYLIVAR